MSLRPERADRKKTFFGMAVEVTGDREMAADDSSNPAAMNNAIG